AMLRHALRPTPLPYTPLFRSDLAHGRVFRRARLCRGGMAAEAQRDVERAALRVLDRLLVQVELAFQVGIALGERFERLGQQPDGHAIGNRNAEPPLRAGG